MPIVAVDHVQLAYPRGRSEHARLFYGSVLGLRQLSTETATKDGDIIRFEVGTLRLDLVATPRTGAPPRLHAAFVVDSLQDLVARIQKAVCPVDASRPLPDRARVFVHDPFGNVLEFIEAGTQPVKVKGATTQGAL